MEKNTNSALDIAVQDLKDDGESISSSTKVLLKCTKIFDDQPIDDNTDELLEKYGL